MQTWEEHGNSTQKGSIPARNQTHDTCQPLHHCAPNPFLFLFFKCSRFCVLSLKKYFLDISYECLFLPYLFREVSARLYFANTQKLCLHLAAAQCKHSLICCAARLNQLRVKGLAQVHLYDDNDNVIKTCLTGIFEALTFRMASIPFSLSLPRCSLLVWGSNWEKSSHKLKWQIEILSQEMQCNILYYAPK